MCNYNQTAVFLLRPYK